LAILELAATSPVPTRTLSQTADEKLPPVSHIPVATVASTITAIRGLVSIATSFASEDCAVATLAAAGRLEIAGSKATLM
jgi:hypothetical protein